MISITYTGLFLKATVLLYSLGAVPKQQKYGAFLFKKTLFLVNNTVTLELTNNGFSRSTGNLQHTYVLLSGLSSHNSVAEPELLLHTTSPEPTGYATCS